MFLKDLFLRVVKELRSVIKTFHLYNLSPPPRHFSLDPSFLAVLLKVVCRKTQKIYSRTGKEGVPRGSVVKCLTRNPVVQGSSRTTSSGFFFVGVSVGQTLQSPSLIIVKPRKDMNNVSCRRDMTEILLKTA